MHEMGIALQIVDIATASIPADAGPVKVAKINLKIGRLAAVVADSLRFCFDIAVKDTPLEGAELAIEELPVVAKCNDCQTQWTIESPAFKCENCGATKEGRCKPRKCPECGEQNKMKKEESCCK